MTRREFDPLEHTRPYRQVQAVAAWMKEKYGKMMYGVKFAHPQGEPAAWRQARDFLGSRVDGLLYYMAGGDNMRGIPHYVVGRDGEMVHDPNPSRAGIVWCDECSWLIPIDRVEPIYRQWPGVHWRIENEK